MRKSEISGVLAVTAAGTALLTGCGAAAGSPRPGVSVSAVRRSVPLVADARISLDIRRCDPGAHAYCAQELVLSSRPGSRRGRSAPSSAAALAADTEVLMAAETRVLRRAGWSASQGEAAAELAGQSPGNRTSLVYATAGADLAAIEKGNITRAEILVRTLERDQADRIPALSLLLEAGSS